MRQTMGVEELPSLFSMLRVGGTPLSFSFNVLNH